MCWRSRFPASGRCATGWWTNARSSTSSLPLPALRQRKFVEIFEIRLLDVDLQCRKHAHHRIVEADGEHEIGERLTVQALAQLPKRRVGSSEIGGHLARGAQNRLGERIEVGGSSLRLLGYGADVVIADAEIAPDLDVVGIFVRRAREIAHLQNGHLAQPRVEAALTADEVPEHAESARAVRTMHQGAIKIDVARKKIPEFGIDVRSIE